MPPEAVGCRCGVIIGIAGHNRLSRRVAKHGKVGVEYMYLEVRHKRRDGVTDRHPVCGRLYLVRLLLAQSGNGNGRNHSHTLSPLENLELTYEPPRSVRRSSRGWRGYFMCVWSSGRPRRDAAATAARRRRRRARPGAKSSE